MALENPHRNADGYNGKHQKETDHHIYPKSRGGTNCKDNIFRFYGKDHVAFHMLFGNLKINEQIFKLLTMGETAHTRDFTVDILKILQETDDRYYYEDGIYLPK